MEDFESALPYALRVLDMTESTPDDLVGACQISFDAGEYATTVEKALALLKIDSLNKHVYSLLFQAVEYYKRNPALFPFDAFAIVDAFLKSTFATFGSLSQPYQELAGSPDTHPLKIMKTLQNCVGTEHREMIGRLISEHHQAAIGPTVMTDVLDDVSITLRDKGIAILPDTLKAIVCDEVRNYFYTTPCYNGHVPAASDRILRSVEQMGQAYNYGSYMLEQSIRAPHLLEFALGEQILEKVTAYLQVNPTLYSINTFWTFPTLDAGSTHGWHRDQDDYRFVSIFIYWTDVFPGDGEVCYIPYTHDCGLMSDFFDGRRNMPWARELIPKEIDTFYTFRRLDDGNGYGNNLIYKDIFQDRFDRIYGPAGSVFMVDTFGLHRGSLPRNRPRLVSWIRYGLYQNEAYQIDETKPVSWSLARNRIPDDDRTRFICRLILKDD